MAPETNMLNTIEDSPLYRIANPRSIAFFGASNRTAAMGTNLLMTLLDMGFEGPIYPVHPGEDRVLDLPAYRQVGDLPETPDLAVLVLPTDIVNPTLEACGQKGIPGAVVVSGGFREAGGEGIRRQEDLVRIAGTTGMRILGPNGLGVANPHHKVNTTFIPCEGPPGFIGLASQSGSFVTQMFNYLARLHLGFSTAFSVGNEADIDLVDCLEYLGVCPHTRVIALYIEGIRRGRRFIEAARRVARRKPIVALYVGGSETGKRAGHSHTGAMAGPDHLYDGVFRQSGIIRARSLTELWDYCWVLGSLPLPGGNRIVVQTHSGGPGAAAADACGRSGLDLPTVSVRTKEALAPFVPHTGSIDNPVDLTYTKDPEHFFQQIPDILLQDENCDLLMVYFLVPPQLITRTLKQMGLPDDQIAVQSARWLCQQAKTMADRLKKHGKPIVGFSWRSLQEDFLKTLVDNGLPVLPDPQRAARAAAAMVAYRRIREKLAPTAG